MLASLTRWWGDKSGNFATMAAIFVLPLLALSGGAIDYVIFSNQKAKLQAAAESAALASVLELGLASTRESDIKPIAKTYVFSNFRDDSAISLGASDDLKIDTAASKKDAEVTVDLAFYWQPIFAHLVSKKVMPIRVSATARLAGVQSICVIALDPKKKNSLRMTAAATIKANKCGIYANSAHKKAVRVARKARLISAATYVTGGYAGSKSSYLPKPVTDSPPIQDPLLDRPAPVTGKCRKAAFATKHVVVLEPGTYCGGIMAQGKVTMLFKPGTYILKDGPLDIRGKATVIGKHVGFYFTGENATFNFGPSTRVALTAPKYGPMAGILFFEDRKSEANRKFVIRSRNAELFEGTVYLPRGHLLIDKESRVGQKSAWTAIIAKRIETGKGPQVEINANYADSTVPVPPGIAPKDGRAILTR